MKSGNFRYFAFSLAVVGIRCHASAQVTETLLPISGYGLTMSYDGSAFAGIYGYAGNDQGAFAFLWQSGIGDKALGPLGGRYLLTPTGISGDGTRVVGYVKPSGYYKTQAFAWNASSGTVGLDSLYDQLFSSYALGISRDGSSIVGYTTAGSAEACRWRMGKPVEDLGSPDGEPLFSIASGVSMDGAIAVGWGVRDRSPVPWKYNGTMAILAGSTSFTGEFDTDTHRVHCTDDGSTEFVRGEFPATIGTAWFRVSQQFGYQMIGDGYYSFTGFSGDGSVAVGTGIYGLALWTAGFGVMDLQNYVQVNGGLPLGNAGGTALVSGDGTVVLLSESSSPLLITLPASASGRVVWNGLAQPPQGRKAMLEITNAGTQNVIFSQILTMGITDGLWLQLPSAFPSGTYDVSLATSHFLRRTLTNVVFNGHGAHGLVFDLINGDVDGDNEISTVDYALLAQAFGSVGGDPNWNPNADLDGDGEVTTVDYSILAQNYGQFGDE